MDTDKMTQQEKEYTALGLPAPRLQLRWEKDGDSWSKRVCHYELVIPLQEYDLRREDDNGEVVRMTVTKKMGLTEVEGGSCPVSKDGDIDSPYRDGAHAKWDAVQLKLPVYLVCGEVSQLFYSPGQSAIEEREGCHV